MKNLKIQGNMTSLKVCNSIVSDCNEIAGKEFKGMIIIRMINQFK
jgi:hypothetical protein